MTEKAVLYQIAREVLEQATVPILGPMASEAVFFHLKQRMDREPGEVLVEDPKRFYEEFVNVLASGADILLEHVGKCITDNYGVSCSSEEFIGLFYRGNESSKEKIVEILSAIDEKTKRK